MSWNSFFSKDIHKVLERHGFSYKNYKVSYKINPAKLLNTNNASKLKVTPEAIVAVDVIIENKGASDAYGTITLKNIPVLKLPLLTDNGFMIRGTRYNCLNEISQADGWYIKDLKNKSKSEDAVFVKIDSFGRVVRDEAEQQVKESVIDVENEEAVISTEDVSRDENDEELSDDSFAGDSDVEEVLREEIKSTVSSTYSNTDKRKKFINSVRNDINDELDITNSLKNAFGIVLHYRAPFGSNLSFYTEKKDSGKIEYVVKGRTANTVPWFVFFRAIYPTMSLDDIYDIYKDFDIMKDAYYEELSLKSNSEGNIRATAKGSSEDCASDVLCKLFSKNATVGKILENIDNPIEELYRRLNSIQCDTSERNRNLFSFTRLDGLTLAKPFEHQLSSEDRERVINHIEGLEVGSRLTLIQLAALDKCESLKELYVEKNGKVFRVPKPSATADNSFINEIKDLFYNYLLVTEGIGSPQPQDIFENKCVMSIEGKVERSIEKVLNEFKVNFMEAADSNKLTTATSKNKYMTRFIPIFKTDVEEGYAKFIIKMQADSYFQNKDDTNSMAVLGQSNQVKYGLGHHVPNSLRAVRPDQYGLICPYSTSEGGNIGLNLYLTFGSEIHNNIVKKKFYVLKNGARELDENGEPKTIFLSAGQISRSIIASAGQKRDFDKCEDEPCSEAYIGSTKVAVPWKLVEFEEIHQGQNVSPLLACVPNFWHNGGKRGVMSVNTLKQVYPVLGGERGYMDSGISQMYDVGVIKAKALMEHAANVNGILASELHIKDTDYVSIVDTKQEYHYTTVSYQCFGNDLIRDAIFSYDVPTLTPTVKMSLRHAKLNINDTNRYYPKDIVIYMNDIDIKKIGTHGQSELLDSATIAEAGVATGLNLNVLFQFGEGYNYEDAMIFNEKLVGQGKFAIARLYTIVDEVKADNTQGTERVQYTYEKMISAEDNKELSHIGVDGLPIIGTFLQTGDVVISRTKEVFTKSPISNHSDLYTYESIKNSSTHEIVSKGKTPSYIYIREGKKNKGFVIAANREQYRKENGELMNRVSVTLLAISNIQQGDKFTGGHGNKGVIGKILPEWEMPFCAETGKVADIVLNPSGVLPRENLGQLIEVIKSAIGKQKNKIQISQPFSKTDTQELLADARACGLDEVTIVDGRTGRVYDKKAFMGVMHIYRSEHDVQGKFNAEGGRGPLGPNLTVTRGPGGGQRFGEQSSWSTIASGAFNVMDSLIGIQGGDAGNKEKFVKNNCSTEIQNTESFANNLAKVHYRMMGFEFKDYDRGKFTILNDNLIAQIPIEKMPLTSSNTNLKKTANLNIDDESLFGNTVMMSAKEAMREREFFHGKAMPLQAHFIFPLILKSNAMLSMMWYIKSSKADPRSALSKILAEYKLRGDYDLSNVVIKEDSIKQLAGKSNDTLQQILQNTNTVVWVKGINLPFLTLTSSFNSAISENPKLANSDKIRYCTGYNGVISVILGSEYLDTLSPDFTHMRNSRSLLLPIILNKVLKGEREPSKKTTHISYDKDDAINGIFTFIRSHEDQKYLESLAKFITNLGKDPIDLRRYLIGEEGLNELSKISSVTYKHLFREVSSSYLFIPPLAYRKEALEGIPSPLEKVLKDVVASVATYSDINENSARNQYVNTVFRSLQKLSDFCINAMKNHETKNAILRDNTLSVRISWSGRGYIVPNPKLQMDQIGLPLAIAAGVFESYLLNLVYYDNNNPIYKLFTIVSDNESESSIRKFRSKLITFLAAGNKQAFFKELIRRNVSYSSHFTVVYGILPSDLGLQDNCSDLEFANKLFDICKEGIKDALKTLMNIHPVIMERAPSLWMYSASCYQPILVDDERSSNYAIELCPLSCKLHNADFDGDQVMVYLLVEEEARKEAMKLMRPSQRPINIRDGKPVAELNQDMALGIYYGTMEYHNRDVEYYEKFMRKGKASYNNINTLYAHLNCGVVDVTDTVSYCHKFRNGIERWYTATVGQILFNSNMPESTGFTSQRLYIPKGLSIDEVKNEHLLILPEFNKISDIKIAITTNEVYPNDQIAFLTEEGKIIKGSAQSVINNVTNEEVELFSNSYLLYTNSRNFTGGSLKTKPVTKGSLDKVIAVAQNCSQEGLIKFLNSTKDYAFHMAGLSGVSISMFDFETITGDKTFTDRVDALKEKVDKAFKHYELGLKTKDEYVELITYLISDEKKTLTKIISEKLDPYNNLYMLIDSGARGKFESLVNFSVMLGMCVDTEGNFILKPSFDNYCSGLNATSYYDTSYVIRQALVTSAISTGLIGETSRNLVYTIDNEKIAMDQCDAESQDVPITYDVILPKDFDIISSVLCTSNDNNWNMLCDEWSKYTDSKCGKPTRTQSLLNELLQKYAIKVMWYKTNTGAEKKAGTVKYKLTNRSRTILIGRTLDTKKLLANSDKYGVRTLPTEIVEAPIHYQVMTKETFRAMEEAVVRVVPMYLAMYCKCKDGICARCFGSNVDKKMPQENAMVGVQTAQTIGAVVSQSALDSHKNGASKSVSSFGTVRSILAQQNLGEQVITSPIDGIVIFHKDKDGMMNVSIKNAWEEQLIARAYSSNMENDILVSDGDFVHKGQIICYDGVLNFSEMMSDFKINQFPDDVALLKARLNTLNEILNLLDGIHARHFDILLRDLLKFSVAEKTKITKDKFFIKGNLYNTTDLIEEAIPHSPVMVSTLKSMRLNGKTASSHAMSYLAMQVGTDAIMEKESNLSSPLCGMMRGLKLKESFELGKKGITEDVIATKYKNRKYGASIHHTDTYISSQIAKMTGFQTKTEELSYNPLGITVSNFFKDDQPIIPISASKQTHRAKLPTRPQPTPKLTNDDIAPAVPNTVVIGVTPTEEVTPVEVLIRETHTTTFFDEVTKVEESKDISKTESKVEVIKDVEVEKKNVKVEEKPEHGKANTTSFFN